MKNAKERVSRGGGPVGRCPLDLYPRTMRSIGLATRALGQEVAVPLAGVDGGEALETVFSFPAGVVEDRRDESGVRPAAPPGRRARPAGVAYPGAVRVLASSVTAVTAGVQVSPSVALVDVGRRQQRHLSGPVEGPVGDLDCVASRLMSFRVSGPELRDDVRVPLVRRDPP